MLTIKRSKIALSILFPLIIINQSYSQFDSCGTVPFSGESASSSSFTGGLYKPHRTDIGGSPSAQGEDYFPILVVFVQYQGETGGNFPGNPDSVNAWPAGRAPNYLNKVITDIRAANSSSWWDSYNGYEINDYWHEFSRGKLHVRGEAFSVILPHTFAYYNSLGDVYGRAQMNKDVFDYLSDSVNVDWPFYDKWKTTSAGNFSWQADSLVDMIYMVFRSKQNAFLGDASGEASIGPIDTTNNYVYTVYQSGNTIVKVKGLFTIDGSGHRTDARGDLIYSRHKFLDVGTHEHGHYLFGGGHYTYCHMTAGAGWEFSLSPWEMVKIGYIQQEIIDYNTPNQYLYDYMSRYGTAGDAGEILQVPISSNGNEFFLLASRRKVSEWDRRISGDTLADDGYQALKNINPEYGKGLYIYHITNGYNGPTGNEKSMDLECADGLWNWEYTGLTRPPTWNANASAFVFRKTSPSFHNDSPLNTETHLNRDEMSLIIRHIDTGRAIWFSPGSRDLFNPLRRGTDKLYTNEEDYWFSLAVNGDRWDGWNVGYNEVFSPYSSPNTNNKNDSASGIFIWNYENGGSGPGGTAALQIYRVGYGGINSEDSILHLTPPSRPMGLRVLPCDSLPETNGYKRVKIRWVHNQEPDMIRTNFADTIPIYFKRYKIYRSSSGNLNTVPPDAAAYSENYYLHIATRDIQVGNIPEFTDTAISVCTDPPVFGEAWIPYPVRYRVQAVDKYDDASVLSDFANTRAWNINGSTGGGEDEGRIFSPENSTIPDDFALKQNYPNPFNPVTNIQYDLPFDNFVSIKIYDILGKEVTTLVNENKNAGRYIIPFNASNYASGIYYYKIKAGDFESVRKMMILK